MPSILSGSGSPPARRSPRRPRRNPRRATSPPPPPADARARWVRRAWQAGFALALLGVAGATFGLFAVAGLQVALRFREVAVPDVSGRTVEEATTALADAGLAVRVEPLSRIHQTIPAGHVAAQDPAPGLPTRSGRNVKVWLSSGSSAGAVPTLIGQSERGARARLEEGALGLRAVAEIRSRGYPSGAVVAQEPPPFGAGDTVGVLINRGERGATYVMPDLIGVYGASAAEVFRARGFRVTVVGDHPYPGIEPGIVLRQSPRAGFQIAHGEAISLEVSR